MSENNPAGAASGIPGYTCHNCKMWVSSYATAAHWCPQTGAAWPLAAPSVTGFIPLGPDPRLIALQEQIAKALERIADVLEGLKKPEVNTGTMAAILSSGGY